MQCRSVRQKHPHLAFIAYLLSFIIVAFAGVSAHAADARQFLFQLSYHDAEEAIAQALMEKRAGDKLSASIAQRKSGPLFSFSRPITVEIHGMQFDKQARRWSASLLAVADGKVITALPASGRFEEMVEVPVLKQEARTGTILTAANIEVRDFPLAQTRADTVTDLSTLIGKTPVRTISAGRPIRVHEVDRPALIKKDALVNMQYHSPGMTITASGQAVGSGAKGDTIEVRNTASKKLVRAVITDANTVQVMGPDIQTSQLTGGDYDTN